jgi:hypothetical protein
MFRRWFADADDVAAERAAAESLRRLPSTPHVIAAISGAGGVGVTSVCAGIAATLGTLWPGQVAYAGLAAAPRLPGVHTEKAPVWTDTVDTDLVARLRSDFAVVVLDIGAHADPTARALMGSAHRLLVVTDRLGRGAQLAAARADEVSTDGQVRARVVVGADGAGQAEFAIPVDRGFDPLEESLLDRTRGATNRALLMLAAWCM